MYCVGYRVDGVVCWSYIILGVVVSCGDDCGWLMAVE